MYDEEFYPEEEDLNRGLTGIRDTGMVDRKSNDDEISTRKKEINRMGRKNDQTSESCAYFSSSRGIIFIVVIQVYIIKPRVADHLHVRYSLKGERVNDYLSLFRGVL